MLKKALKCLPALLPVSILTVPAFAILPQNPIVLHDWEFNDPIGTTSSQVVDSIGGSTFNNDINTSGTTGDGFFKIQRDSSVDSVYFGYAPITGNPGTGSIWLVVDVAQWNFTSTFPRFRASLQNEPGTTSSTFANQTASVDLRPGDSSGIGGFGSGGTPQDHINYQGVITDSMSSTAENSPVRLVLEVNQDNNTYSVFYSFDNITYTSIGTANTDPTYGVNYVGFGGYNNFTGDGMDLDRIYVVVPEPSTYALFAGLGILGLALWRRRRS